MRQHYSAIFPPKLYVFGGKLYTTILAGNYAIFLQNCEFMVLAGLDAITQFFWFQWNNGTPQIFHKNLDFTVLAKMKFFVSMGKQKFAILLFSILTEKIRDLWVLENNINSKLQCKFVMFLIIKR